MTFCHNQEKYLHKIFDRRTMDLPSLKLVLLGDSGVGKTTILARWMTGKYCQSLKPTVGTNYKRKVVTIKDTDVELFIWDTAGQEQYQSLMPLYTRNAASIIIVCAVDDLTSLQNVNTWAKFTSESLQNTPPLVLAVNKIDKTDDLASLESKIQDAVHVEFSGVFFVSALTGENIDTLMMHTTQKAFESTPFTTLTTSTLMDVSDGTNKSSGGCC